MQIPSISTRLFEANDLPPVGEFPPVQDWARRYTEAAIPKKWTEQSWKIDREHSESLGRLKHDLPMIDGFLDTIVPIH